MFLLIYFIPFHFQINSLLLSYQVVNTCDGIALLLKYKKKSICAMYCKKKGIHKYKNLTNNQVFHFLFKQIIHPFLGIFKKIVVLQIAFNNSFKI